MIKIFESEEFGRVRTVIKNGEPWFVGKDVAVILGYSDVNKAVAMHVDNEDKKLNDKTSSSFGQRGATLINESGLYSLILSSKMPRAKGFKRWVTANILPTLRRTGGYVANEDMFIENYLPFLVKKNGTWRIDNLTYPFFLTFQEEGAEREAITEITYPIVQGKRHITLTISPGCSSNSYVYSFEKIEE